MRPRDRLRRASTKEQLESALVHCLSLALLDSVSIHKVATLKLLRGSALTPAGAKGEVDDCALPRGAFSAIARRIATLHVRGFTGGKAARMLAYFPNARHLHVSDRHSNDPSELPIAVVALQALESLSFTKPRTVGGSAGVRSNWSTADWSKTPLLRVPRFNSEDLAPADWAFVQATSTSLPMLEAFELNCRYEIEDAWVERGFDASPIADDAFPSLLSLRLQIWSPELEAILPSFSTLPLRTLELALDQVPAFDSNSALVKFLATSSPQTRIFFYSNAGVYQPLMDVYLVPFLDWCPGRGIPVTFGAALVRNPLWLRRDEDDEDDEDDLRRMDVVRLRRAVDEVLEFGLVETTRLECEGDLEGVVKLAGEVAELKGRLLLAKD